MRALLSFFILAYAVGTIAAYEAVIKLRNSSLSINTTALEPPQAADALAALQFSLAQGGVGLYERADYASAYVNNDTLQLEGGLNPLDSFATVEANNSYLLVNNSAYNYTALELLMVENNTLSIQAASLLLNSSTLRLARNNWLLLANSSMLSFTTSRLNFTDWFTWWVDSSAVTAANSILSAMDVLTWWQASQLVLDNATLTLGSAGTAVPVRYEGKVYPLLYSHASNINATSSKIVISNLPFVHIGAGTLSLAGTDLVINNSTVNFAGDAFDLRRATIYANNATLLFTGNNTRPAVSGVSVYTAPAGVANATALGSELVGSPLGGVDTSLPALDADVEL